MTAGPRWAIAAGPGTTCCPCSGKSEHHFGPADDFHGTGGEWRVEEPRVGWEILDAFERACNETGIARTPDFNDGDNEGTGKFMVNQRRGARLEHGAGLP